MFYPLTLNLSLTEKLFALLHFQINIIYSFLVYYIWYQVSTQHRTKTLLATKVTNYKFCLLHITVDQYAWSL